MDKTVRNNQQGHKRMDEQDDRRGIKTIAHLVYKMEMKLNNPKLSQRQREEIRKVLAFAKRQEEKGRNLDDIIWWLKGASWADVDKRRNILDLDTEPDL